ncbi:hypothetical protein [Dethiosulfatarculus sandiegensis]|uniref:Glutamate synthase alpha subunit C-terminal domain-containing protein n=1 Tax=Dethiosulfatarculus sandiegensis TaxID=1429043 RepID=A0A0D2HSJ9_9BACT|nr:hypothetical protein [Dethiosulfatarculus sandiegensis]KIX13483.1 hypothetical protein X474_13440 [Dethiosulfatarculus sandiegensis]
MIIDAQGVYYKKVNELIHQAVDGGAKYLELVNVKGQRYIGTGLPEGVELVIKGVPGNDLACFMNGARINVLGNAQDAVGNTMNQGKVVIHGVAGDIVGYAMRGGKLFVKGDVGYRAGIHMKAFHDRFPVVAIGGGAQDYLGEYMAGGVLVVFNLNDLTSPVGSFTGTGMHGGMIYVRGKVEDYQVGAEVGFAPLSLEEWSFVEKLYQEFTKDLGLKERPLKKQEFTKLYPKSARPYGNLYAY